MHTNFKTLIESLDLLLIGMVFVLGVLFLLYGICALVGRFFSAKDTPHAPIPATPRATPQASNEPSPEEITVVIAAAIDQLFEGQKYRVVSVKPLNKAMHSDWAQEGRCGIFTSHRIR